MINWVGKRIESESEFKVFAKDFKKYIKQNLPEGAELIKFNKGYFYISGFIAKDKKFVYFSIPDVRFDYKNWYKSILIRTASSDKDFTGGSNHYTDIDNFKENIIKLFDNERNLTATHYINT